jgi:hypothetical protein
MVAISLMVKYLNSTYGLQVADTKMEAAITTAEANLVEEFEKSLTQSGSYNTKGDPYNPTAKNFIWQLEHLTPENDPNYKTDVSTLTSLLGAAQSKNQANVKIMDGNNSTAQNVLSQNAQGQQGVIASMSSINGIEGNLARILQG